MAPLLFLADALAGKLLNRLLGGAGELPFRLAVFCAWSFARA
jgi:hypothetical protein